MAEHRLGLLDSSCVIAPPERASSIADAFAVSTLTVAELAYGLHTTDRLQAALREERYRQVLASFEPVPYSARAAHLYGALAAAVRDAGRDPRPRRIDLMIASVAADLGAVVITRNPDDFSGLGGLVTVVAVSQSAG